MKSLMPAMGVKDISATVRFYTDVLGFETIFTLKDDDDALVHASMKRGVVDIMFGRLNPDEPHDQGELGKGVALYTTVADTEDIDGLFAHARKSGAEVIEEPKDQFWGHRDWTIADPDGYLIVVSKVIAHVNEQDMQELAMAGASAS